MADFYQLKLLRKDRIASSGFINLMNLHVDPANWPMVLNGLEALKRDNPEFTYSATFLDRIVVGEPPLH